MTIWKFPLRFPADVQTVAMPRRSEILSCQLQDSTPTLWAVVDPEEPTESRTIRIFGTGHTLPEQHAILSYIGTVQMIGGALVWHVFVEANA